MCLHTRPRSEPRSAPVLWAVSRRPLCRVICHDSAGRGECYKRHSAGELSSAARKAWLCAVPIRSEIQTEPLPEGEEVYIPPKKGRFKYLTSAPPTCRWVAVKDIGFIASAASFPDLGEWLPQGPLCVPHLNLRDRMNLPGTHAPFPHIGHMREIMQEPARESH